MTNVAVLGAGHGGLAAAADLTLRGFGVRLQNRSEAPLRAVEAAGGIRTSGALGDGLVPLERLTTDLGEAVKDADAVVLVLPAVAHEDVAGALAARPDPSVPLVLNPGHMCGSLHVRAVFDRAGKPLPPLVELGTLTYICRSPSPGSVEVYLRAIGVPASLHPAGSPELAALVHALFPGCRAGATPVETWLHDVNLVLHPPGMILGAAWLESSRGGFRFYADGVTRAVAAVMDALDRERRDVGRAYGAELPPLAEVMAMLGSADPEAAVRGDLAEAVRGGRANREIRAPQGTDHRYLHEDVPFGLVPLMTLARAAGVPTPVAESLTVLAEVVTGRAYRTQGLNARALGIEGMGVEAIVTSLEAG